MAVRRAVEARSFSGTTAWVRNLAAPLRAYLATEVGGALVLLAAAVVALAWANSPWGSTYESVWTTRLALRLGGAELGLELRQWINEGLMALFFFVVGLEIRRELDLGALRERRRIGVPVLAALGGMAAAIGIYLAFNAGTPTAHGWGAAMSTDTAFALGALSLVARRAPQRLRVFMLTLVTVDDIAALVVIGVAYTDRVSVVAVVAALALFAAAIGLAYAGVRSGAVFFVVGVGAWLATLESGISPTVAGVTMGLLASAYLPARERVGRATELARAFREQPTPELARTAQRGVRAAVSPNERLQHLFHPWTSYVVVPLFVLANAGVDFGSGLLGRAIASPVTLGIFVGFVVGKPVGIAAGSWLANRVGGLRLPVSWPALAGAGAVAGTGFSLSLLIATLAFHGEQLAQAKVGILGAAVAAPLLAFGVFRAARLLPTGIVRRSVAATAPPLLDIDEPVDPARDHVRGPADAPVTLVEYGDYECPYCGRAEGVVRELLGDFAAELRYVFRHLPLADVHDHAELAAEAAEAAAAQCAFWPMHDLLFDHQDALEPDDLRRYADELDLDAARLAEELRRRAYAPRVAEDVESADRSGVAGTPTFFINGRRHYGAYDVATLGAAVREARRAAAIR